jgi:hypothetical protein
MLPHDDLQPQCLKQLKSSHMSITVWMPRGMISTPQVGALLVTMLLRIFPSQSQPV